jgi:hypothetical protein
MRRSGASLFWESVCVVVVLAAIYGGICLLRYCDQRLLFCNDFGFSEKHGIAPSWHVKFSEVEDAAGNRFLADFRKNLLLVAEMPTNRHPVLAPAGASEVEVRLADDDVIALEIDCNLIITIHTNRTVSTRVLMDGGAEELFGEIKSSDLADRTVLVAGY